MRRSFASAFCAVVTLALAGVSAAEIALAPLFSDGMVWQRDQPHPVWGKAGADEWVSVSFGGQQRKQQADQDGRWRVVFDPLPASSLPQTLVVSGRDEVRVENVVIGDVWLCSGQSNMEWAVSTALNPEREARSAHYPLIRHCKVARTVSGTPAETVQAAWRICSPETVLRFSAVGYFFARDQFEHTGVPVGIVTSAWGGTEIEAWLGEDALRADSAFAPVFERWAKRLADYPAEVSAHRAALDVWERDAASARAEGRAFNRRRPAEAEGPGSRWMPGGLFNGMIHPLIPFPFAGVLWYQGEANEFRATEYGKLFRTLIAEWRREFVRPKLPFYFVQLANFATRDDPSGEAWAFLREAQAEALALSDTGMVVTIDIGEDRDIHYKNKQEVGRRLSRLARAGLLGEEIETSGPRFVRAERDGDTLRLSFSHAAGLNSGGGPLVGFEVAADDRRFVAAEARIEAETLLVRAPSVGNPVAVRYAWSNTPQASLFNSAGLPASPFRSARW